MYLSPLYTYCKYIDTACYVSMSVSMAAVVVFVGVVEFVGIAVGTYVGYSEGVGYFVGSMNSYGGVEYAPGIPVCVARYSFMLSIGKRENLDAELVNGRLCLSVPDHVMYTLS